MTKRKSSPAPTARYGNAASPYQKKRKRPARYSDFKPLDLDRYASTDRNPVGHPAHVQAELHPSRPIRSL